MGVGERVLHGQVGKKNFRRAKARLNFGAQIGRNDEWSLGRWVGPTKFDYPK